MTFRSYLAVRIIGREFLIILREEYLGNILFEGAFEILLALRMMEPCDGIWIFFAIQGRIFAVFHFDASDVLKASRTNRLTEVAVGVSWSNCGEPVDGILISGLFFGTGYGLN